ncbi:MAG: hypothetical protein ACJ8AW_05060, partial [Rhodopila sp.]
MDDDPGFQMCPPESRRRLARFINFLSDRMGQIPRTDSIELVINGDMIDFLAEEPFAAFSATDAVTKLERAVQLCDENAHDDERVFAALRRFVGLGHKLTIILGNHDIELSLPPVRRALMRILTDDRPARLEFVFDGEAYAVGDVLIEHGNRYDGWNAVKYGELRALRSALSRNEAAYAFTPPAGSRLVASIMNPLKRRYRFIDLLKPENETILPILCALEPTLAFQLRAVAPLWFAMRRASGPPGLVRREESFIANAAARGPSAARSDLEPDSEPREAVVEQYEHRAQLATEEVLAEFHNVWRALQNPASDDRVTHAETQVAHTSADAASSALRPDARHRLLSWAFARHRKALATTFALNSVDPPYHTAAQALTTGRSTRIVIFGHTHLPKAIGLAAGGYY